MRISRFRLSEKGSRGRPRESAAVSSFRLRARLDVSIPSTSSGQQRLRTPLLGYGAPHLSARGTSTLLNNALLSAHFRLADDPPNFRWPDSPGGTALVFFGNNQDRPRIIFPDASRLVSQEAGLRNDLLIVYKL